MTLNQIKNHTIDLYNKGILFEKGLQEGIKRTFDLVETLYGPYSPIALDIPKNINVSPVLQDKEGYTPFNMLDALYNCYEIASTVFENEQNVTLVALGEQIVNKGHLCLKKSGPQYSFEYIDILNFEKDNKVYYLYKF
jgi:hypothetical protein